MNSSPIQQCYANSRCSFLIFLFERKWLWAVRGRGKSLNYSRSNGKMFVDSLLCRSNLLCCLLCEKSTKTKRKSLRVALSHVNSFGEIFYYIFHSTSSSSRTAQFHSSPSRPRARRPRPAPMLCCRATPKATRSRAFSGRRTTTRWNTQIAFISPRTIKHWILTTLRSRMRDYMLA